VLTLVQRARRRLFGNELLSQGANAFSAAVAVFILLLLLGTQVLDWRLALLIPLVAAGAGFFIARRRLPGPYQVAQLIDHRIGLADSLSTAFYFSKGPPAGRVSPEVRQAQFECADRLAASVDPRRATPFTMPRTMYLLGILILVASSLFALRYGLSRKLDLRLGLAHILQQSLGIPERTEVARNQRRRPPQPMNPQGDNSEPSADPEQAAGAEPDSPDSDSDLSVDAESQEGASGKGNKKQNVEGEDSAAADQDAEAEDRDSKNGDSPSQGQQGDSKSGQQPPSVNKQDNNSSDNSSLMNKVKDAWQNLLSRMKPQPGNSNSGAQQRSMEQSSKQGKGQQNGKQQSAKNGQQSSNGQEGDSEDGQPGDEAQNAQDPQGKGTGKSDSAQTSKQPGSGIGSQDGDKNIKQSEQLAAMGRITEIFGKRSANITGEATVEVHSTSQQLRTPYAQRSAQHSDAGGAVNRDEIPVALQPYVEQYFEQIRKPPAKKQ